MEGPGTHEARPHYNDLGRPALFKMYMLCVHLKVTTGSNEPQKKALVALATLWR